MTEGPVFSEAAALHAMLDEDMAGVREHLAKLSDSELEGLRKACWRLHQFVTEDALRRMRERSRG